MDSDGDSDVEWLGQYVLDTACYTGDPTYMRTGHESNLYSAQYQAKRLLDLYYCLIINMAWSIPGYAFQIRVISYQDYKQPEVEVA